MVVLVSKLENYADICVTRVILSFLLGREGSPYPQTHWNGYGVE
jgi:hypothetical protein